MSGEAGKEAAAYRPKEEPGGIVQSVSNRFHRLSYLQGPLAFDDVLTDFTRVFPIPGTSTPLRLRLGGKCCSFTPLN